MEVYHANVAIAGEQALVGCCLEHLGRDDLLDGKDDAVLTPQRNRRPK